MDFCESARQGIRPTRVHGTRAKDESGKIINNPPRHLVNVNETPIPDFSLFDKRRFTRPLGMQIWNAILLKHLEVALTLARFVTLQHKP